MLDGTRPDQLALAETRVALVIGAEGAGIRPGVLQKCDFRATIPMASGVESLNASVSAGVLMYEMARR